MGWNRSKERDQGSGIWDQGARKSPFRGLVAGAIVVIGAAIAAWCMWPEGKSAGETPPPRGKILVKEVTPAKASQPSTEKKPRRLDPNSYAAKLLSGKQFTNEFGYVLNRPVSPNAKTNYMDIIENQYLRRHFKTDLDYNLANFLATEPGEDILGDLPPWFKSVAFVRQLEKSMDEPIVINPDDPTDIQELKRALMDTKEELHKRIKAGENIGDLIEQSYREMQDLGAYRQEIEAHLDELSKSKDLTEADMEDFLAAANKMLAERGISAIEMPRVAAARFRYYARRRENRKNREAIEK